MNTRLHPHGIIYGAMTTYLASSAGNAAAEGRLETKGAGGGGDERERQEQTPHSPQPEGAESCLVFLAHLRFVGP